MKMKTKGMNNARTYVKKYMSINYFYTHLFSIKLENWSARECGFIFFQKS